MIKLVIFDIDNTLAKSNQPVEGGVIKFLRQIESSGTRIALISGKPTMYISGMARQIGLVNPIISGENGGQIYNQSSLPPQKEVALPVLEKGARKLDDLKLKIVKTFGKTVWIQPNLINLTIFPKTEQVKQKLFHFVANYASEKSLNKTFNIYIHSDSIELVPLSINKGVALRKIRALENLKKDEVIAVGDEENDIPMFKEASISIGINLADTKYNFPSIKKAIEFIQGLIARENKHG